MTDDEEINICSICNKPILTGEGRYTAGEHRGIFRHWDCYKPELDRIEAITKEVLGEARKHTPRRREGHGKIAQKIARMLTEALKRELDLDVEPEDFKFWVQPPTYRGPRWDLAVWGASIEHPEHRNRTLMFHSWDTMTRLSKQKKLDIRPEDVSGMFDVS